MPHSREYLNRAQELERATHEMGLPPDRKEEIQVEAMLLAQIYQGKALGDIVGELERLQVTLR